MRSRGVLRVGVLMVTLGGSAAVAYAQAPGLDIPRRADGRPDLSGTYDIATLTPLQRPVELADKLVLTEEEAATLAAEASSLEGLFNIPDERNVEGGAPRAAPPVGGDGSSGAAGNVGGYNSFWMDFGQSGFRIDGQFRTSIITDPPNGRRPPLTAAAGEAMSALAASARPNTGTAWWLEGDLDAPGPYDHPERRPHAERCLMGFGSTAGPPMLPVLYNNLKRIIQSDDTVMILVEMVHDARIVRMHQEHVSPEIRTWLGDSVGRWDGDTLVVDTTNFRDSPSLGQASRDLHVVEQFSRIDGDTLLYEFTVDDPTVWAAPWSGEYVWPATDNKVYEYACHEANYSFGGILRGARVLEADARGESSSPR